MSNRNQTKKSSNSNKNKKERSKDTTDNEFVEYDPNEVYEEDLEGEEEEEEEEYDPEKIYVEQQQQKEQPAVVFDVSKLSPDKKKDIEHNNKKVLFLKALSLDCYQDIYKLGRKCQLPNRSEIEGIVSVMMGMISETGHDFDFPFRTLRYFNSLVPDGYPGKIELEAQDINELTNLFQVTDEKLQNIAKISDPDKYFGPGIITDTKTINPVAQKENVVMMDSQHQQQQQGQGQGQGQQQPISQQQQQAAPNVIQTPNQPYQRVDTGSRIPQQGDELNRDIEYFAGLYAAPDIGLMEMALKRIPNPRPNSVTPFINSFSDLYTDWMGNPMKMIEELKFFFGPTHGEHAYRLWKDYRERYMKKLGYSPLPSYGTSTGEYSPYNFQGRYGGGSYDVGMGLQPMMLSPEDMEDKRWNRKMDKMMKMIEMKLMSETLEAQQQTPAAMYGQSYEEILDPNGKVIKRVFLGNNGHGGGAINNQATELTLLTTVTSLFKEMMAGKNAEMVEVLRKVSAPDSMLTDFTKTIMSNFVNQANPASQIREMLEITNMVKSQSPQDNQQKSIEAIKMDIDSKIALQELDLRKMEMQHNWRMDEKQTAEQDHNVDKWLNMLMQMGESIVKPAVLKFVDGFGGANRMPPQMGMFTSSSNPAAATVQAQQEQAMREQALYQQRQAQQGQQIPPSQQQRQQYYEPPLQPIPPTTNNPYAQQQQRQYNNQQQQQGQPLQKNVSQVSEQEIQQELAQMTPQQIQEIEDKMTLDDINREKIKSAILKHKNARRGIRTPTPQQQEAQNILSNMKTDDLDDDNEEELDLGEEDFDDEDEEENTRFRPTKGVKYSNDEEPTTTTIPTTTTKQRKFSEFMPESSTDIKKHKKLTKQQEAMLAEGQLSPRELANAPDIEIDENAVQEQEDEYGYESVPIAGSIHDESREALIEENLKRQGITRQGGEGEEEKSKKSKFKVKDKVKEKEKEKEEDKNLVEEAENVLDEAELIPSDDDAVV